MQQLTFYLFALFMMIISLKLMYSTQKHTYKNWTISIVASLNSDPTQLLLLSCKMNCKLLYSSKIFKVLAQTKILLWYAVLFLDHYNIDITVMSHISPSTSLCLQNIRIILIWNLIICFDFQCYKFCSHS